MRRFSLLCRYVGIVNFKFMHERILCGVFKSAWREEYCSAPDGKFHIRTLRRERCRLWWDGVKHESVWLRKHFGFTHFGKGGRTEWEDVLVEVYGVAWRSWRDSHRSSLQWLQNASEFVCSVCRKWGLPGTKPVERSTGQHCAPKRRKSFSLDDFPESVIPGAAYDWDSVCRKFVCVVDCRPVQQVLCGCSALVDDSLRPVFSRTARHIAESLDAGWTAPRRWHDPVYWKRREMNKTADYLVNFTMDEARSWTYDFQWPFEGHAPHECNFVAYADGGTRNGTSSAAAWFVEVGFYHTSGWTFKPISMGGHFLSEPESSFLAESIALEECLRILKHIILHDEPRGKRVRVSVC